MGLSPVLTVHASNVCVCAATSTGSGSSASSAKHPPVALTPRPDLKSKACSRWKMMRARRRREHRHPGMVAIRHSADIVGGGLHVINSAKADVRKCITASTILAPIETSGPIR
jgi:hypothetical protein